MVISLDICSIKRAITDQRIQFNSKRENIIQPFPAKTMSKRKLEVTNDEQKNQQVPKLRFHWTPDLHCHFELAVNSLGGPFEAKPSTIREAMEAIGASGLTTKNIKSHLQKYREKYRQQVSFADSLMIIGERQSPSLISNQIIGSAVGKMTVGAGSSGVHGQIQKASEVKGNWGDGLNKFTQKP